MIIYLRVLTRFSMALIFIILSGCGSFVDYFVKDEGLAYEEIHGVKSGGMTQLCTPEDIEDGSCWSDRNKYADKEVLKEMLRQTNATNPEQIERIVERIYK